jgi:hypothetical protein
LGGLGQGGHGTDDREHGEQCFHGLTGIFL